MVSGLRCEVDENCVLLGCYTAGNGNSLLTFRDNLSVPSSSVKNSKRKTGGNPGRGFTYGRVWAKEFKKKTGNPSRGLRREEFYYLLSLCSLGIIIREPKSVPS